MTSIVDPDVLKRLIAEMDERYQRLSDLQRSYDGKVRECGRQRERLTAQISHLRAILETYARIETADQLLGVTAPAQAVEDEETMYLGATVEESLGGRIDDEVMP